MAAMVEGAGVPIAVTESGDGPPVLLIHRIGGHVEPLAPRARTISYDRRGYGSSGAPEPYEATTVNEQAEDAAAVLRALDAAPATVFGDGFGALVALDLLVRRPDTVRAAVLRDPPLFAFVPEATEALSAERRELEEALREGGPEHAVERLLGPGARAAHRAVFADLAGLASWPTSRAELRAIAAPLVVLTSSEAPPHVAAAADALAGLVPGARRDHDADVSAALESLL